MTPSNNKRITREQWNMLCHTVRNNIPVIRQMIKEQRKLLTDMERRSKEIEDLLNTLNVENNNDDA